MRKVSVNWEMKLSLLALDVPFMQEFLIWSKNGNRPFSIPVSICSRPMAEDKFLS